MKRILIVDDDVELCELVAEYLRREGLETDSVHDGEAGLARAQSGDYAVVVLDVMLPGIGGFEVLRRLRTASQSQIPVVMLTARGDEVDRVLGLELGADDYLPKPFSSRELVARIRAILRRANATAIQTSASHSDNSNALPDERLASGKLVVSDVELDAGARTIRRGGALVDATAMEFKLLELLMRAAGEVVTREEISLRVLERPLLSYDRSIDIHVSNLRRKLDSASSTRNDDAKDEIAKDELIKTVRGFGYVFVKNHENSRA